jgi:hypothetical protein
MAGDVSVQLRIFQCVGPSYTQKCGAHALAPQEAEVIGARVGPVKNTCRHVRLNRKSIATRGGAAKVHTRKTGSRSPGRLKSALCF